MTCIVDHVVEVTHDKPMLNAMRCGICGGPGDRYPHHFQCRNHPGHMADLVVGIWTDLTHPEGKGNVE